MRSYELRNKDSLICQLRELIYLSGASATCFPLTLSLFVGAALQHCSPYLREIPACKASPLRVHPAGGDCLGANSCTQILVTRPMSVSTSPTCHACRLPPGTWPSHGSSLSQWFSNGGVYCRIPTPHAQIRRELSLSLLGLRVWLGNHLSCLLLLFRVPRPEASTPLPCRPLHGCSCPWVSGGGTTQI